MSLFHNYEQFDIKVAFDKKTVKSKFKALGNGHNNTDSTLEEH